MTKIEDFELDIISMDEKSYENILVQKLNWF